MINVLKYPLLTEKSAAHQANSNQYSFAVDLKANKIQIREAVQALKKGIEVESVRTLVMRGKVKRLGRNIGKRPNWKKAVVRLKQGQSLELFESA
jgi:large subunit ribosomal protein L23